MMESMARITRPRKSRSERKAESCGKARRKADLAPSWSPSWVFIPCSGISCAMTGAMTAVTTLARRRRHVPLWRASPASSSAPWPSSRCDSFIKTKRFTSHASSALHAIHESQKKTRHGSFFQPAALDLAEARAWAADPALSWRRLGEAQPERVLAAKRSKTRWFMYAEEGRRDLLEDRGFGEALTETLEMPCRDFFEACRAQPGVLLCKRGAKGSSSGGGDQRTAGFYGKTDSWEERLLDEEKGVRSQDVERQGEARNFVALPLTPHTPTKRFPPKPALRERPSRFLLAPAVSNSSFFYMSCQRLARSTTTLRASRTPGRTSCRAAPVGQI